MTEPYRFLLPDLGEGLPDATVVEWLVQPGQAVRLDEPLVAMETAKAVVEVPAPCSGRLLRTGGATGSVIITGHLLAEFEIDPAQPQRAAGHATGHHHAAPEPAPTSATPRSDAGTVVGAMTASDQLRSETVLASGGVKAMPAVRALARKLGVDLHRVRASSSDGVISSDDVKRAAAGAVGALLGDAAPAPAAATAAADSAAVAVPALAETSGQIRQSATRTLLSQAGKPLRTQPPGVSTSGQPEPLRGVRRNMARVMAEAHRQVVLTTLVDDADLHAWSGRQDISARLVRAICVACRAEPALNAWFDGETLTRTLHAQVDLGIAVDTAEGLFVPALRNADMLDAGAIRTAIARLRAQVEDRSIAASELSGHTISLSNFGMYAGRYATPVVVPPSVAIVGAGRISHDVVAVMGAIEAHRRLPISLSFDHRACTGGEAARFLAALLDDLAQPH